MDLWWTRGRIRAVFRGWLRQLLILHLALARLVRALKVVWTYNDDLRFGLEK